MRATRKPLTDDVWRNWAPDEKGHEPMPNWVRAAAESGAVPGAAFMLHSSVFGPRLCRPGHWVVRGPTDVYPVSPEGFALSYDFPPEPMVEEPKGDRSSDPMASLQGDSPDSVAS